MLDLRSFAKHLEDRGDLVRITREVSPEFEMPALMEQLERQRKAFIFENVRGARLPVMGGLLNKLSRFGEALGAEDPANFGDREFDAALEAAKAHRLKPVTVKTGPVKEDIRTGDAADLSELPVPTFFDLDSGPFITAAIGTCRDPDTGEQNVGVYRTLILGPRRCVINASSLSDLRQIYRKWHERGKTMPIALAIGVDPAVLTAAACKLPPDFPEYEMAGALQGKPVELVKCETSDLLVPAGAELVIEGTVDLDDRIENVLGEFAGQYGDEIAPATEVTAITGRRDAYYYAILAGRNPEHNTLGSVAVYGIQRSIHAAIQANVPEVKRVCAHIDPRLGTMAHVVVSIDKTDDAQPRQVIEKILATGGGLYPLSMIVKRIIVVDDDIDVESLEDVQWAMWTRMADENKIMVFPNVESWELERCAKEGFKSLRAGIDATMDLADVEKLVRPVIRGADRIRLEDYLDKPDAA